ncbi:MAG TPA: glycosyltransferase family 4 protein, partial [Polyangia bacterium]
MRTFAMVAPPGTFLGETTVGGTGIVVGRAVANTMFLRALGRWGSFERFVFFVGEAGDVAALEAQRSATGVLAGALGKVTTANLLTLPDVMAAGGVDVIHLAAFSAHFADLVWLRDRHARAALPITAQIHSLSYPRFMNDYLRACLHPPGAQDAVICSSQAGRNAVAACFARAGAALGRSNDDGPGCALPVIPLGVDAEALTGGARDKTRARLGVGAEAALVLGMGRFTEYDKMDLFPLLQAFRGVVERIAEPARKPVLLLAGARQGTKTPEMVQLWAKLLGIADRVRLEIDFADAEKANLLAAADVFVSPSDNPQETFGLSVVEAMAAGLPVVVSDFDGYKDTVTEAVGIRVPARAVTRVDRLSELG